MTATIPTPEQLANMSPGEVAAFEQRLRRAARHEGLHLEKSRRRDPRAPTFGRYRLRHTGLNQIVWTDHGAWLTLHAVAQWLWE